MGAPAVIVEAGASKGLGRDVRAAPNARGPAPRHDRPADRNEVRHADSPGMPDLAAAARAVPGPARSRPRPGARPPDLYAMNPDGSAVTRLTHPDSKQQQPAFTLCKGAC